MAAMNAIDLLESSAFRDPDQIPLPNDSPVQALTQEQFDKEDREEGKALAWRSCPSKLTLMLW